MLTNFSKAKKAPKISTAKSVPTTTNFAKGIVTYKPNDTMDYTEIYLAQNARFDRIGEYATRKGLKALGEPIGKAIDSQNYSESYTMVDLPETGTDIVVQNAGRLYSLTVKVSSSDTTGYGVLKCTVSKGGQVIATGFVDPSAVTSSASDVEISFASDAPLLAASDTLTVTFGLQSGNKAYKIATVSDDLMYKLATCENGYIGNIFESNIGGLKTIFFTFIGTTSRLYAMAEDGTTTQVQTLPVGCTKVRFTQNVNTIYYTNGLEGPHKITRSGNNWVDSTITTTDLKTGTDLGIKVSNIMDGTEDNLDFFDADTTTQLVWTYPYGFSFAPEATYTTSDTIAEYDSFETTQATNTITMAHLTPSTASVSTGDLIVDSAGNYATVDSSSTSSTFTATTVSHIAEPINRYDAFDRDFRQNFPAIETGDPLTAMFNLGGVEYILTRKNKYLKYSQSADVWSQARSTAQNGTFSQESVVCDLNYAYYANDNGIYVFDGTTEASLTQNTIQNVYDAIPNKESIVLDLYGNRLYVFYDSENNGKNDKALVYNINLKLWESFDTGAVVSATCGRKSLTNRFICGHSGIGLLMLAENDACDYSNLGGQIDFDLNTSYLCFGRPAQIKRIEKWRPEFATVDGNYAVACGYAFDFTDVVKYAFSVNLKDNTTFVDNYVWKYPSDYGVVTKETKLSTVPIVYGQWRRCQLRYQHHAAYEPVNFKSHTIQLQVQRIR